MPTLPLVVDASLAGLIWERVRRFVVPVIEVKEDDDRFEFGLCGTWRAYGINPVLLFGKYGPGAHFSPHTDGNNVVDFNNRSLHTVIVYMNDCGDGGRTHMFTESHPLVKDDRGRLRFPPRAEHDSAEVVCGEALCFAQDLLHEGEPVGDSSEKRIIRTDVMYARDPPLCDDRAGRSAYATYLEAQRLEGQGRCLEAGRAYSRARRECPELARHLKFV